MIQKIKFHFAGLDEPIEEIVDDIDDFPTCLYAIDGVDEYGYITGEEKPSSVELDILLSSQQDVVKLIYKLSELIDSLPK